MKTSPKIIGIGMLLASSIALLFWIVVSQDENSVAAVTAQAAALSGEVEQRPNLDSIPPHSFDSKRSKQAVEHTEAQVPESPERGLETIIAVRMFDSNGAPLNGARVRIENREERVSAADGEVRLFLDTTAGKDAASYRVEAQCDGFARSVRTVVAKTGETTWLENWHLVPSGEIFGSVTDEMELGLEGVTIVLIPDGQEPSPFEVFQKRPLEIWPTTEWRAQSGPDGSFLMEAAPMGSSRLFAFHEGHPVARSVPFELHAGETLTDMRIVVTTESIRMGIRGRVLLPNGSPAAFAQLELQAKGLSANDAADSEGYFEFHTPADASCNLVARDRNGQFGAARMLNVAAGTMDVELRLLVSEPLQLKVTDDGGTPIPKFTATLFATEPRQLQARYKPQAPLDGTTIVPKPAQVFEVQVSSAGYRTQTFGPFAPENCGDELLFQLTTSPGIRGRVSANDRPREGVVVSLHREALERSVHNGFDVRMDPFSQSQVVTDADGQFLVPVSAAGDYFLVAELDGWALAEVGPLTLGLDRQVSADMVLRVGATLEVEVLASDGSLLPGAIVGISRGDGRARTKRTDSDGLANFSNLTAGPWLVLLREKELRPGENHLQFFPGPPITPEPTTELTAGSTSRIQIVLEEIKPTGCKLLGRLRIDGKPAKGWITQLHSADLGLVDSAETARLGKFKLAAKLPGTFDLLIVKLDSNGITVVRDIVDLVPGATAWRERLETGSLSGHVQTPAPASQAFYFTWEGPGNLQCFASIAPDEFGNFKRELVPVGKGGIALLKTDVPLQEQEQVVLVEVEVRKGETSTVQIP